MPSKKPIRSARMNSVASGLALIFTLASGVAAYAQDTGDAAAGAAFARTACGSCHATQARQEVSPNADAPPFQVIAEMPSMTGMALTRVAPHVASDNAQPAAYTG